MAEHNKATLDTINQGTLLALYVQVTISSLMLLGWYTGTLLSQTRPSFDPVKVFRSSLLINSSITRSDSSMLVSRGIHQLTNSLRLTLPPSKASWTSTGIFPSVGSCSTVLSPFNESPVRAMPKQLTESVSSVKATSPSPSGWQKLSTLIPSPRWSGSGR